MKPGTDVLIREENLSEKCERWGQGPGVAADKQGNCHCFCLQRRPVSPDVVCPYSICVNVEKSDYSMTVWQDDNQDDKDDLDKLDDLDDRMTVTFADDWP